MFRWFLSLTPEAESDLRKLDKNLKRRVSEKLDWLAVNFDKINPLKLSGDWQGYYKLRIGDLRVIYEIKWGKSLIIVRLIDWRDKIYKRHN